MNAIVAVDAGWGIGFRGQLLEHIPEDLKRFKEMTTGKIVVMGRKTLESLPGGKPLPNRHNVVLSRNPEYKPAGVTVCESASDLFKRFSFEERMSMFVIGGGAIYAELLVHCRKVFVTFIYKKYEADTFFPDLTLNKKWMCVDTIPVITKSGIKISYLTFENLFPVQI